MRRLIVLCVIVCSFLMPVSAQEFAPFAGWITNGELWLASVELAPVRLVPEAVAAAYFSPAQSKIAYLRITETDAPGVIILSTQAPYQTLLVATGTDFLLNSLPVNLVWVGEEMLYLNTVEISSENAFPQARWDLWRIDLQRAEVVQVLRAGEGGKLYPQPAGNLLAMVHPGEYGVSPAQVMLMGSDFEVLARFEYLAVSSGSITSWLPDVHWQGDGILFQVPDADLLYAQPDNLPMTQLVSLDQIEHTIILRDFQTPYPAKVLWQDDQPMFIQPTHDQQQVILDDQVVVEGSQFVLIDGGAIYDVENARLLIRDYIFENPLDFVALEQDTFMIATETAAIYFQTNTQTVLLENPPPDIQFIR